MTAARLLAQSLNAVSAENVRLRTEADGEIARQVGAVNDALYAVKDINAKINTLRLKGEDISALQDERDRIIDAISAIIPVRVVKRDGDQVALYTANGGALLDGRGLGARVRPGPDRDHARHDRSAARSAG